MNDGERRLKTVAVLSLLGTPSFLLCFYWHVCMDGHMRHAPYPLYEYASDLWWSASFTSILVFSCRLRARSISWLQCGSMAILFLRFFLGGALILIELPLLIMMNIYAIKYLLKPDEYLLSGTQQATLGFSDRVEIPDSEEPKN